MKRPGLSAKARSGYTSLPVAASSMPVLGYEAPALARLDATPLPNELPILARALVFPVSHEMARVPVLVAVPTRALDYARDDAAGTFAAEAVVLMRVRDAQGQVVHKASEEYGAQRTGGQPGGVTCRRAALLPAAAAGAGSLHARSHRARLADGEGQRPRLEPRSATRVGDGVAGRHAVHHPPCRGCGRRPGRRRQPALLRRRASLSEPRAAAVEGDRQGAGLRLHRLRRPRRADDRDVAAAEVRPAGGDGAAGARRRRSAGPDQPDQQAAAGAVRAGELRAARDGDGGGAAGHARHPVRNRGQADRPAAAATSAAPPGRPPARRVGRL